MSPITETRESWDILYFSSRITYLIPLHIFSKLSIAIHLTSIKKTPDYLISSPVDSPDIDEAVEAGETVVLDFSATWCGPCQKLYPCLQTLAKKFPSVHSSSSLDDATLICMTTGDKPPPLPLPPSKELLVARERSAPFIPS
jgi:thiol-disulfide isomerase/thioredoxin